MFGGVLVRLGEAYADHRLVVVLDGAPSHTSSQITLPDNVSLLRLPAYSPELNPVERWFQGFRRVLSNRVFESVELLQEALTKALEPYWQDSGRLRSLIAFCWWVGVVGTSMLLIGIRKPFKTCHNEQLKMENGA